MASSGAILTKQAMIDDINSLQVDRNNYIRFSAGGYGVSTYNPVSFYTVDSGWTLGAPSFSYGSLFTSLQDAGPTLSSCGGMVASAFPPASINELSQNQVNAGDIVLSYKNLAKVCTRLRQYRAYFYYSSGNGCASQSYRNTYVGYNGEGDSTFALTSVTSSWNVFSRHSFIDNAAGPNFGEIISASSLNTFFSTVLGIAGQSTSSTYRIHCARQACHCNCHTSCHSSRARR